MRFRSIIYFGNSTFFLVGEKMGLDHAIFGSLFLSYSLKYKKLVFNILILSFATLLGKIFLKITVQLL
jgi:hypothetical protein